MIRQYAQSHVIPTLLNWDLNLVVTLSLLTTAPRSSPLGSLPLLLSLPTAPLHLPSPPRPSPAGSFSLFRFPSSGKPP